MLALYRPWVSVEPTAFKNAAYCEPVTSYFPILYEYDTAPGFDASQPPLLSAVLPALPTVTMAKNSDVPVTVAEPLTYPVLVVLIVAVELVLGSTPVMVAKPVLLIATEPDAVAVPAHV